MTSSIDSSTGRGTDLAADPETVEMPRATAWPIVLALGITLLGAGLVASVALSVVGAVLFVFGLGGWIGQLLPGRGHRHEAMVEPALRPRPVDREGGRGDRLRPGVAGYRFQLPMKVHPISAGVKGGIVGGLVMPIPALAYGLLSGHGLWFPINLLAGMVVPGISGETLAQLEQFSAAALVLAIFIHATLSVTFGLLFGVVSPTLAADPGRPRGRGGGAHAAPLDGPLLRLHGDRQPGAPAACELALVHRLAGGVWPGHVDRRDQFGEGPRAPGGERPGPVGWCPRSRARVEVSREFAGHLDAASPSPIAERLDVAGPARRLGGGVRLPRSARGRRPVRPAPGGKDVRRPVPAELRRLPRGGRQAGPGTAAERHVVPGPGTGRGVAAGHRGRPARARSMPAFADAKGGELTAEQVEILAAGIKPRWGPAEPAEQGAPHLLARARPRTTAREPDEGLEVF